MTDALVKENERVDDLHRNGRLIIQNPKNFCFGVDAVLLSGFARVKKGERALDLCTGTGVVPILLEAKTQGAHFSGVEIQPDSADMARRSIKLNGLEDKIAIDEGDIKDIRSIYKPASFDVVTVNPPYMPASGGLKNDFTPKAIARHELLCTLQDVLSAAALMLGDGGRLYMVHRPHRLVDIIDAMRGMRLEPKTMRFVHPRADREPNMVLIEGIRGGGSWLKVMPPLVIYKEDGDYTEEVYSIYYG